jgi:hypothetical protein
VHFDMGWMAGSIVEFQWGVKHGTDQLSVVAMVK